MTRPLPLAAAVLSLGLVAATPAAASIQDDIKACGAVAIEAGLIPAEGVSLRFVSDKGNRNRTLTLKAIYSDGSEPTMIACKMKRREVLEATAV